MLIFLSALIVFLKQAVKLIIQFNLAKLSVNSLFQYVLCKVLLYFANLFF